MEKGRREFIKNATLLSGGICIGTLNILTGCSSVNYVTATQEGNKFVIKKSDWGEGDFVIIKTRQLPKPVYVSRLQVVGEWARASIEIPGQLGPNFGDTQWGLHTDLIYNLLNTNILRFEKHRI